MGFSIHSMITPRGALVISPPYPTSYVAHRDYRVMVGLCKYALVHPLSLSSRERIARAALAGVADFRSRCIVVLLLFMCLLLTVNAHAWPGDPWGGGAPIDRVILWTAGFLPRRSSAAAGMTGVIVRKARPHLRRACLTVRLPACGSARRRSAPPAGGTAKSSASTMYAVTRQAMD